MSTLVGNLVATLALQTEGFAGGWAQAETIAARGATRISGLVDQFGRPVETALARTSAVAAGTGRSLAEVESGLEKSARAARSLIGPLTLIDPLLGATVSQMSAIAIGSTKVAGGLTTLALTAVGVAGLIGGALYQAWVRNAEAARGAAAGYKLASEQLATLEQGLPEKINKLAQLNREVSSIDSRKLRQLEGPFSPTARQGRATRDVGLTRDQIDTLAGNRLLEDPNAGPAGPVAKSFSEGAARRFGELTKGVEAFQRTARAAAEDDPLRKMLMAEREAAEGLIRELRALTDVPQNLIDAEIAKVTAGAGQKMDALSKQFSKAQGPDIAQRLGLGDSNLLAGFREVEQLTTDVRGFSSEMERLAKAGIPVRDLFPQIAEAQGKLDEKIRGLKDRFRDSPAVFNQIVKSLQPLESGGLQKGLDALVRGLQGVRQGSATVIDTAEGFENRYTPALSNAGLAANYLAGILFEDVPAASRTADAALDVVTRRADAAAAALRRVGDNALYAAGALAAQRAQERA